MVEQKQVGSMNPVFSLMYSLQKGIIKGKSKNLTPVLFIFNFAEASGGKKGGKKKGSSFQTVSALFRVQ